MATNIKPAKEEPDDYVDFGVSINYTPLPKEPTPKDSSLFARGLMACDACGRMSYVYASGGKYYCSYGECAMARYPR